MSEKEPRSAEQGMIESICREVGVPNLVEILGSLALRRLQPILVHAWNERVADKKPESLLADYESKLDFYGTGQISQSELYKFAGLCYEGVPSYFDKIQMSPIAPVGLNSVLTKISQNNTLPTIRGSEVVSDITTQLALECAHRRKSSMIKEEVINLCSFGRVLRLQPFDKDKGYMQHFNLFALCSGGINPVEKGNFAVPWLKTHIATLLDVIANLQDNDYQLTDISVRISDMKFLEQLIEARDLPLDSIRRNSLNDGFDLFNEYGIDFPRSVDAAETLRADDFKRNGLSDHTKYFVHLDDSILTPLRESHPDVDFDFDFTRKAGLGYYPHICFHIFGRNQAGEIVQIADGGAVDWLAKLRGNRKEAMVTSGIGSELIQKLFSPET